MTERSFSKFNRVISGHFHKFQQKGNLTYLGTPFSHSFGESNQTKYIGVLDLESDDLKLIETEFPKHITEVIDCDKCQDYDLSGYDPEDHIRIVLEGSQENINKTRSRSILESRYKFIERPTDDLKEGLQIEETLDNKVKFNTWARDIRKLDEATIELGISILEAVK